MTNRRVLITKGSSKSNRIRNNGDVEVDLSNGKLYVHDGSTAGGNIITTGYTGSVGATGFTGSIGATGFTGSVGARGYTGSVPAVTGPYASSAVAAAGGVGIGGLWYDSSDIVYVRTS